jgi:glycosyltransferase involved in cell wall biosynthesis
MKVLILHFRSAPRQDRGGVVTRADTSDSAGTDGVSLEMYKRQSILQSMGHEVAICSAYDWADLPVAALEFDREEVTRLNRNLFAGELRDFPDEAALERAFRNTVEEIKAELRSGLRRLAPDLLYVHNVLCLPVHPAATVALTELLAESRLPCVAIHHDILSEGAYKFRPSCDFAGSLLADHFPPRLPNLSHWTINTRNQRALAARGFQAKVIHDSMNFQERLDSAGHEKLRLELRTKHSVGKSDIVLLVGARIAPNKQTELAGRVTAVLSAKREQLHGKQLYNGEIFRADSRIILVLAGRGERAFAGYRSRLFDFLNALGLDWEYVGDSVLPLRSQAEGYYALYPDMYTMADFVLYPSGWEGFGNQLLEAFAAGLPVVVFEYPVFQEDIAPKGVEVISLGDKVLPQDESGLVRLPDEILESAARRMISLLTNRARREAVTSHNLEIGKRHFDFSVLRDHLAEGVEWAQRRITENSQGQP